MTEFTEKKCQKCGQKLRIPKNIGGMLMACPSCGDTFHSDFKLGGVRQNAHRGIATTLFELPSDTLKRLRRLFPS